MNVEINDLSDNMKENCFQTAESELVIPSQNKGIVKKPNAIQSLFYLD